MSHQARFTLAIAISLAAHASSLVWGNFPLLLLRDPSQSIVLEARLMPDETPAPPVPVARPFSEQPGDMPVPARPKPQVPQQAQVEPALREVATASASDARPAPFSRSVEAPPARTSIRVFESVDFDLLYNRPMDITRGRVFMAFEVGRRAQALDDIDPQYPLAALAAALEGTVVLMLVIDDEGKVAEQATLVADPPLFEAYAAETIRHVRWAPAELAGKTVRSLLLLEFRYRVER